MIRRIELPFKVKKPILACGADLKGAFAVASKREAILVDGFGDLGDPDNFTSYEQAVKSELKKLKIEPEIVACDLHPGYFSTRFAESFQLEPCRRAHLSVPYSLCRAQHHEAHVASAIVDHSLKGRVIGVAFDGTGYGSDGNIWGGEFFIGGLKSLKRSGHFEYVAMPGADLAIREPWRMAASYLYQATGKPRRLPAATFEVGMVSKWPILKKMIGRKINSPLTSSAGRLFDAVGSLVLSKPKAGYEAELPVALEKLADRSCGHRYDFGICKEDGLLKIDNRKIIKGVIGDMGKRIDNGIISAKFHNTIAEIILEMSLKLRKSFKIDKVTLSGGVFQNKFLTSRASQLLKDHGFDIFANSKVPTNDSGIPIGQIAIANARQRCA